MVAQYDIADSIDEFCEDPRLPKVPERLPNGTIFGVDGFRNMKLGVKWKEATWRAIINLLKPQATEVYLQGTRIFKSDGDTRRLVSIGYDDALGIVGAMTTTGPTLPLTVVAAGGNGGNESDLLRRWKFKLSSFASVVHERVKGNVYTTLVGHTIAQSGYSH